MTIPFVPQGTLNRLRCSIVLPGFTALNITAPYMGKSFARVSFQGNFNDLIPTGTGGVVSPEPYVIANVSVGLLRTQALSSNWQAQALQNGALGEVKIHPDSASYPTISLDNCVINDIDPGAFDGTDPVVRLTIKGIYYINSDLWNL